MNIKLGKSTECLSDPFDEFVFYFYINATFGAVCILATTIYEHFVVDFLYNLQEKDSYNICKINKKYIFFLFGNKNGKKKKRTLHGL